MSKFWAFMAPAETERECELTLYGEIGVGMWSDVSATMLVQDLAMAGGRKVHCKVNSIGGDAFAGIAIYNALKGYAKTYPRSDGPTVRVTVEGLAASAASLVAMAGPVHMARGAMMMEHNPAAMAAGDAADLREHADALDKLQASYADIYCEHSGMDRDRMLEMMNAGTWLTAKEAMDCGLAQTMDEAEPAAVVARGDAVFVAGVSFRASAVPCLSALPVVPAEPDAPASEAASEPAESAGGAAEPVAVAQVEPVAVAALVAPPAPAPEEDPEMAQLTAIRAALALPESLDPAGVTAAVAVLATREASARAQVEALTGELASTRAELAARDAAAAQSRLDAVIRGAIEGDTRKVPPASEAALRALAQASGVEALEAFLATLPVCGGGAPPVGIQGGSPGAAGAARVTLRSDPRVDPEAMAAGLAAYGLTAEQVERARSVRERQTREG